MPHDVNNQPLAVGDGIVIPCVITEITAGEDFCNCTVETVHGRRPDGAKERFTAFNTAVVAKSTSDMRSDAFTHRDDGTPRHPATVGVLRHFRFSHLPPKLQSISRPVGELAIRMADTLPEGPDLTCGLRDLLSAKDNLVRAALPA